MRVLHCMSLNRCQSSGTECRFTNCLGPIMWATSTRNSKTRLLPAPSSEKLLVTLPVLGRCCSGLSRNGRYWRYFGQESNDSNAIRLLQALSFVGSWESWSLSNNRPLKVRRSGFGWKKMQINAMCCDEAPSSHSHMCGMAAERRSKRLEPIWTEQSTYKLYKFNCQLSMFLHMPRGAQRMYGQLDDVSNLALKYHICTWHLQLHLPVSCTAHTW